MKTLQVVLMDAEFKVLTKAKQEAGLTNWRQFLVQNARAYLKLKAMKIK